jgi:hypothetical protein
MELKMEVDVDFGDQEQTDEVDRELPQDPDEFLARNSFRIVYQTNNFFLPQIREMIKKREAINLRPEYQRRLRWTNTQKSKLVESLLLNIPVPPVFFYEADAARYEVMDGQQRLNAIHDFFSGDFALSGLTVLEPLIGLRYTKCPPRVRRTLDRATISAIVLLMESGPEYPDKSGPACPDEGRLSIMDIRRLVFDRVNTGGRQLNAQEIRNALNPGPLNNCIVELSRFDKFTEVFGIPPYAEDDDVDHYENPKRQKNSLYASMRDCELVLRVFALRRPENIRGSMKSMLDRAMAANLSDEKAQTFAKEYREHFEFLYELFDKKPFNIPGGADEKEKVSAALYDAAMVALSRIWERHPNIQADKTGVVERLKSAVQDEEKYELIVGRKNTATAVKDRIELLQGILLPE